MADVTGKRIVTTRLHHSVTIREENATAALEVMSRFAANPKWLIYLPPTMSPTETTDRPGLLEHPQQAFDYFRSQGVGKVICEEKHMGSRAVGGRLPRRRRGPQALRHHAATASGIIYTRTGRRFFDDRAVEAELLDILHAAMTAAGFWEEFASDWFCLDCELMPWSAKAQDLLKTQYAAVGSASRAAVAASVAVLEQAADRYAGAAAEELHGDARPPAGTADAREPVRRCLPPILLAGAIGRRPEARPVPPAGQRRRVHVDKDHLWHMQTLARLADAAPGTPLMATAYRVIDVTDPADVEAGIAWWEQLTGRGGEGMVVKPLDFVVRGKKGLVQPAVKCRGPRIPADHLRPRVRRPGEPAAPAQPRPGGQAVAGPARVRAGRRRRWSDSSAASRCGGSTNASSACWRWRASRWTRDCRPDLP